MKRILAAVLTVLILLSACSKPAKQENESIADSSLLESQSAEETSESESSISESKEEIPLPQPFYDAEFERIKTEAKSAKTVSEFLETEYAKKYLEFFLPLICNEDFEEPNGVFVPETLWKFLWSIEDISQYGYWKIEDGREVFHLPKDSADFLMERFFGVTEYETEDYNFDPKTQTFFYAFARDAFDWDLDVVEIYSIRDNVVTYKCVYHYPIFDYVPGPFYTSLASLEVLEDENGFFFRAASCSVCKEEFETVEAAKSKLI